jgi:glucose-1-phosphate cytidylyltransferase
MNRGKSGKGGNRREPTKVVLLAGGMGTRLAEETGVRPKPMVEIGGRPLLVHIMSLYAHHGFREFLVATGYKGEQIKQYFRDFFVQNSDFVVDLAKGAIETLKKPQLDWRIGVIDTGKDTMTGGRLKRLEPQLSDGPFLATYGDGVADLDVKKLVDFHRGHGKVATITAVRPPSRFGGLELDGSRVARFSEKPQTGEGWINGGFFVFEPAVFDYLKDDATILEREPLERLATDGQLMAFRHEGFWQPMDTLREKQLLETLFASGKAPWPPPP